MSAAQPHRERCQATKKDGTPCQAAAVRNGHCVGHQDPAENAAWRAKGGAATSNTARAAKLLPSRLKPIVEGLERAFLAVERTDFDTKRAGAMAALARALIAVFEASEFEARIRILEQLASDEGRFRDRRGNPRGGPVQWPRMDA